MGKKDKVVKKVMKKKAPAKVKKKRHISSGIVFVKATFNNTIVTVADPSVNVVAWSSAGKSNFSGSRKSAAFAATIAAQDAAKSASSMGMKEVEVMLKGAGAGREAAVRGIVSSGITVTTIKDVTPIAHNGCRPRKRRRG